jgi:hypothetical protein
MNANDTKQRENLFASVRLYSRLEIPARLVNREWTLMDAKQSENLFASIRVYSRLEVPSPTDYPRMDANGHEPKRELIRVYSCLFAVGNTKPD